MNLSDQRHFQAAQGWLDLGAPPEALEELDQITSGCRNLPDVLKLRWRIHTAAGRHARAFDVAERLTEEWPDDPEPFVWRSESARKMKGGGCGLALELLLEAVNEFEDEPILPFRVACYECRLGNLDEARAWLHRALELAGRNGTTEHWKSLARHEPDLERMRNASAW